MYFEYDDLTDHFCDHRLYYNDARGVTHYLIVVQMRNFKRVWHYPAGSMYNHPYDLPKLLEAGRSKTNRWISGAGSGGATSGRLQMKHAAPLGCIWDCYSLTDASKTFTAVPVFDNFAPIECFIDYLSGYEGDEQR